MDIKKINPISFRKEALLAAQNSGGLYTADRMARIFKYVSHVPAFIAIGVSGFLLAYSFTANTPVTWGILAVIATSVFWAGALMLSFTGVISGLTRDKILDKPYKRLTRGLLLNNERRSHREALSSAVVEATAILETSQKISSTTPLATFETLEKLEFSINGLTRRYAALQSYLHQVRILRTSEHIPKVVRTYVDYAECVYRATMTPGHLGAVVEKFLTEHATKHPSLRQGNLVALGAKGYVEMDLRRECLTGIDWVIVNRWQVSGSALHKNAVTVLQDLFKLSQDERDETDQFRTFRQWWELPDENALLNEKVLLLLPAHVYETKQLIKKGHLSPIADAEGAPIEYVVSLWKSARHLPSGEMNLHRVVSAARKLTS